MLPANQRDILPLTFPVDVLGIKQQATVIADVSDMASFKYKVRFEDGFEDIFTIVEGPELSIEGTLQGIEHYANALLNDLYILTTIEPGVFFYMLPMELDGESINVWIVDDEPAPGDSESVTVSYHQHLQFELYLIEGENWRYREHKRPLSTGEIELAKELAGTMESIRLALQL